MLRLQQRSRWDLISFSPHSDTMLVCIRLSKQITVAFSHYIIFTRLPLYCYLYILYLKSFSDNVLIKFNIADPIVGKLNSKCFWKFYRIYIFIIFMYKFVIFCFLYRRNSLMWITLWMKMYKISQNKYPWWYWLLNTRCYVAQTILISCAQIG